jgi:hypothetical protein
MTGRISFFILAFVVLAAYQLVSSQKPGSSQRTIRSRTATFNGYDLVDKTRR